MSNLAAKRIVNAAGDLVEMTRHDPAQVAKRTLNLQEAVNGKD
jgi:hypothetical protein